MPHLRRYAVCWTDPSVVGAFLPILSTEIVYLTVLITPGYLVPLDIGELPIMIDP